MTTEAAIRRKLEERFAPEALTILNESHLHAGHHHAGNEHHEGFDGTGETHFRVRIVSSRLSGLSRVERHRAVNAALAHELETGVHALAIEASAPGEPTRRGA